MAAVLDNTETGHLIITESSSGQCWAGQVSDVMEVSPGGCPGGAESWSVLKDEFSGGRMGGGGYPLQYCENTKTQGFQKL